MSLYLAPAVRRSLVAPPFTPGIPRQGTAALLACHRPAYQHLRATPSADITDKTVQTAVLDKMPEENAQEEENENSGDGGGDRGATLLGKPIAAGATVGTSS